MNVFKEIEFSMRQLVFLLLAMLIFIIVVFFFGFSQGRRYERMRTEERLALQKDTLVKKVPENTIKVPEEVIVPKESIPAETVEGQKEEKAVQQEEKEKAPEIEELKAFPEPKILLYYVQVGAFKNREYALSTLRRFEQKGYDATIINPENNFRFYRVVIGGYEDEEEAVRVKYELEDADETRYYIIQHEKSSSLP